MACDVEQQIEARNIAFAQIDVTKKDDRRDRAKLIKYFDKKMQSLDEFKQAQKCCLDCKEANKVLSPGQREFWEKIQADVDIWAEEMKRFKEDASAPNPDTPYEHAGGDAGTKNKMPGAEIDLESPGLTAPVTPSGECANLKRPEPESGDRREPGSGIFPMQPLCRLVQTKDAGLIGMTGGGGGVAFGVTACQVQFCKFQWDERGSIRQRTYVLSQSIFMGGSGFSLTNEQQSLVPMASGGRDNSSKPAVSKGGVTPAFYNGDLATEVMRAISDQPGQRGGEGGGSAQSDVSDGSTGDGFFGGNLDGNFMVISISLDMLGQDGGESSSGGIGGQAPASGGRPSQEPSSASIGGDEGDSC
ncbi:hypothetical protein CDD83_2112 [Cordyceps sp. RAO-2017]|nr:hypothetical protein CDD83_2112 [Cordyceps sp. RAO-2017]